MPSLKAFLKAHCQSVSGNKQELVAPAVGGAKQHFLHILMIFWSAEKQCKDIFSILHHLVILANATVVAFVLLCNYRFNFYCYPQREAKPNQKSQLQQQPFTTSFVKDYEGHSLVQTSFAEVPDRWTGIILQRTSHTDLWAVNINNRLKTFHYINNGLQTSTSQRQTCYRWLKNTVDCMMALGQGMG